MKVWRCTTCGFVYDETIGDPAGGIVPGTRWEDVPDDWICPDCGETKSSFEMELVEDRRSVEAGS